jgi:hypothetical protein
MYRFAQHRTRWARPPRRRLSPFVLTLIAAGVLAAAAPIAGASAQTASAGVTVTSHFVWTATPANSSGDSTFINNFATNDLPGAILFITPNWDAGGVCGCIYDSSPVGVFYDTGNGQWAIFNENLSAMPAGASFNVLVVPAVSSSVFVQTATAGNSGGDSTFLNSSRTNGLPATRLMVTQVWDPGGSGGIYNNHAVGVWYDSANGRWAIFQEDKANMTTGASFNVMVGTKKSGGGTSALQTATTANTGGDTTFISNAKTTGNPNAVVFETPNWDAGGFCGCVYDSPPTGIWWSDTASEAAVFNEDHSSMPLNAAFNLIIYQS